jgi:polyhydroxybutyrate depolymerase
MKVKMVLLIISGLLVIVAAMFFYFVYTPTPAVPTLSSNTVAASIQFGGKTRTFLSYRPEKLAPAPGLIIVLHGTGIDGERMRAWTGYEFEQAADHNGFLVVYPDGYKRNWNDCRKGNFSKTKQENIDDVGFIAAIVKQFRSQYNVDSSKVFLFGYSSGGVMAFRVGMEQPALVSGIATICAAFPTPETVLGKLPDTMPRMMMINGTDDPICPYNGGPLKLFGRKVGVVVSAQQTARMFAAKHGVHGAPVSVRLPHRNADDPSFVDCFSWQSSVVLYAVNGGGHVIPQPVARFPRFMGRITGDVDAPDAAIKFFGFHHSRQYLQP